MLPMHLYQLGLNSEQLIKINPLVKLESSWSSHLSVNCIEVQASNKQVFEQYLLSQAQHSFWEEPRLT